MTVKELEESFEKRIEAVTRDKESGVDDIKQKFKMLEETLQVQTTRINEKIISAVVESRELPPTKLNDDEPVLDISSGINQPCDKCDFDFDEEDDLDAHNEIYHENKCDICDIDFEEEDALQTHKEIYHKSRSNSCDIDLRRKTLYKHTKKYMMIIDEISVTLDQRPKRV